MPLQRFEFEIEERVIVVHAANPEEAHRMMVRVVNRVGLGDAVASVAKPIAAAVDKITTYLPKHLRTRLKECEGCKQRAAALNAAVPDALRPFSRDKG